jgi:FkbM family methyltransferase
MKRPRTAIERAAAWFNGLGLWHGPQSVWGERIRAATFDRWLYLRLHRHGAMGRFERRTLAGLVRPGMKVVDVGGNLGLYTVLLARQVGAAGQVISFEPDPELFDLLRENCAANGCGQVACHNLALGSRPGRMILNKMSLNSGDNHLGTGQEKAFYRPVEVQVETLDRLLPDLRPDFVKIDVQGWELEVLRGMEQTLRASPHVAVYVEFWPGGMRRAGSRPEDLFDFLQRLGFRVFTVSDRAEQDAASFALLTQRVKGLDHADLFASRDGLK